MALILLSVVADVNRVAAVIQGVMVKDGKIFGSTSFAHVLLCS